MLFLAVLMLFWSVPTVVTAFQTSLPVALYQNVHARHADSTMPLLTILAAQVSQKEAQNAIDKVVKALQKDSAANQELGKLQKVTVVLGFGSPQEETVAVRFNASFKKLGSGLSSVPLPFGLGQSNEKEGRGTMVGQVKASVNQKTGKIISVSVFRDLGYGRAFNLKL